VGTAGLLALAIVLPTAAGYAVVAVRRALGWRAARQPALPAASLERLGADLRRLHAQLDATEFAPAMPAKRLRRDAVRAAYVDALTTACRRVGVAPPAASAVGRVSQAEIYRVESDLRGRGLDVREAGAGP
jgi:hypothetical protein